MGSRCTVMLIVSKGCYRRHLDRTGSAPPFVQLIGKGRVMGSGARLRGRVALPTQRECYNLYSDRWFEKDITLSEVRNIPMR